MTDFDALFRLCAKDLMAFLRRRVASAEVASDLAQEAFYRLMRSDAKTAPDDARAYLFRTAANLAIDHRRLFQLARELLKKALHHPHDKRKVKGRIDDHERGDGVQ